MLEGQPEEKRTVAAYQRHGAPLLTRAGCELDAINQVLASQSGGKFDVARSSVIKRNDFYITLGVTGGLFVSEGRVVAVYVGLITRPLRFVVRREIDSSQDVYEVHRHATYHGLLADLLTVLNTISPGFMKDVAELDDQRFMASKHKTRRYVAEDRDLLYIDSPHLAEASKQVLGYWVVTNIGRNEAIAIAGFACRAAGVKSESMAKLRL